jgi:TANFOR domain-containing protein
MKTYTRCLLIMSFVLCAFAKTSAQSYPLKVVITVAPPYPVSVSYYADHPEQVLVQIINVGRGPQSFRLTGSITGLDNGIQVVAKDRGASAVLTINPNESRMLTAPEVQDLFDPRRLTFSGLRGRQGLLDDNLPEGMYQVCVTAIDAMRTTAPLSETSCSQAFSITNLEPPMIISPQQDAEVKAMPVQNVIFTWTLPAGAPPLTEYTIRMVEVAPRMNANQAILSATTPPFFERPVQGNVLLYGPADPPLVPGRRYAFVVAAKDPQQRAVFRNNGRSEVHTFTYAPEAVPPSSAFNPVTTTPPVNNGLNNLVTQITALNTTIAGRLTYAFPEDYTLGAFTEPGGSNPSAAVYKSVNVLPANFQLYAQNRPGTNTKQVIGYNLKTPAGAVPKPLQHVRVSLVKTYAFSGDKKSFVGDSYPLGAGWNIVTRFANSVTDELNHYMNGQQIDPDPFQVLDTKYTDANGNYSFLFPLKDTCRQLTYESRSSKNQSEAYLPPITMHRVCVVVVESPYFCSPFMMLYPQPGDNLAVPELISLVKSVQQKYITMNDLTTNQAGGKAGTLEGINLEVFRVNPTESSMPKEEGQQLPAAAINALNLGDYGKNYPPGSIARVVALNKTGGDGSVIVSRIVRAGPADGSLLVNAYTGNTGGYTKENGESATLQNGYTYTEVSGTGDFQTMQYLTSFNNSYGYERKVSTIVMASKPPRILGRVVESTKGLPGVTVSLMPQINTKGPQQIIKTDKDGYFSFQNLPTGDYVLSFLKAGYYYKVFGTSDVKSGGSFKSSAVFSLQMGTQLQTNDIQLIPGSTLVGVIKDEDGKPIVCDIQLADGAFYKTQETGGAFEMPAQVGKNLPLKIYPRSDEYMDETYTVTVEALQGKMVNNAGILLVHRNRHRIKFIVAGQGSTTPSPLAGAMITVAGIKQPTNEQGEATFIFESPGEKFLVSVKPPKNSNYSHWEEEIPIPVVKKASDYTIVLQPGIVLDVTVKYMSHGTLQPAPNAKVYIKQLNTAWDDNPANYVEAVTNAEGKCPLKGIPNSETSVEVFVSQAPDANGSTYAASSQVVTLPKGKHSVPVSFTLQPVAGFAVTRIWGYPVQIESVKKLSTDTYQVSGSFVDLPGNDNFKALNPDTRLDFKDVVLVKNTGPTTTVEPGQKMQTSLGEVYGPPTTWYESHIPKDNWVFTRQHDIAVRILKGLQGHASGYGATADNSVAFLAFSKTKPGRAVLKANVKLDLASFKGAYQLKGDINLGSSKGSPVVDVLNTDTYERRKFFIGQGSNSSGNNQYYFKNLPYRVHGFTAEADVERSYISNDTVNLYTILHTNIPTMTPGDLALQAGYITILPNDIIPFDGGDAISFSLEKWKATGLAPSAPKDQVVTFNGISTTIPAGVIPSRTWWYDKNNGGIVIPKVFVNTGVIGITLQNLIIQPDRLIADKLSLDKSNAALSLGGIIPVTVLPDSKLYFTYDPNCYHDNKPHWKLSLLNSNGRAAEIKNLDGLEDGQVLAFESMNLFSDNQQQLSGSAFKNLVFRKVLNFSMTSVDVGSDYVALVGDAQLDIPNFSNGGKKVSSQLLYTKGSNGKAALKFKPLYFDIEGAGKVTFQASDVATSQSLTSGQFTADGTLTVYDVSQKAFTLQGRLVHQKNKNNLETYIEVGEKQQFPLAGKHLDIKSGITNSGMRVESNSWQSLALKTVLPIGTGGFEMLKDEEQFRTLTLQVKGAIITDPSTGMVGLKGMDTGMGSISLFYDFNLQALRGNFLFSPAVPLNVGIVNITSANVSMAVGEPGIFMMNNGTGEVALPGGIPLPLDVTINSVTGYYTKALPPEDMGTLTSLLVHKELPEFMHYGIKGAFATATASIVPFHKGYDLTGDAIPDWAADVHASAKAELAFEVRSYVNYTSAGSFDLFSGVYGYGSASIEGAAKFLSCGPEASVSFDVQFNATQSATTPQPLSPSSILSTLGSVKVGGCGSVGGRLYLGACFLGKCLGFPLTKYISLHCEISPPVNKSIKDSLKVWVSLDDCGNSMPVTKVEDSGY